MQAREAANLTISRLLSGPEQRRQIDVPAVFVGLDLGSIQPPADQQQRDPRIAAIIDFALVDDALHQAVVGGTNFWMRGKV